MGFEDPRCRDSRVLRGKSWYRPHLEGSRTPDSRVLRGKSGYLHENHGMEVLIPRVLRGKSCILPENHGRLLENHGMEGPDPSCITRESRYRRGLDPFWGDPLPGVGGLRIP